ncbi:MAG: ATP-dependent Clp protease ATP-binding subunit [Candidatus Sumerlaeia bacterium]|nr:ATP-dependent Clp protease ATP-binding subunit [Candidatus Sumerlaeia bacterium]
MRFARAEAGRLNHDYIGPEHYILGIIRKGDGLAVQTLNNLDVDLEELKMEIERMVGIGKGAPPLGIYNPTAEAKQIIEGSKEIAHQMKHSWIGTEHLLLSLIRAEATVVAKVLRQFGVTFDKAQREVLQVIDGSSAGVKPGGGPGGAAAEGEKTKTPALDAFGRDLTALAREGKLDPVIGREDEIERILQVLCRRTKNNPILLGEPGVGKTAIVEGLAQKIVTEDIPEPLLDKRLLSLDLAAVVAGTKYRGQFEERLKQIMHEIRRSPDVLIFIDELHTLVGAGAAEGAIDASNMLKPALSRGELQCIGATTQEEFRKYIEKDGALERRFQPIHIAPPTVDQTIDILKGLRSRYEQHHGVIISDEALDAAAHLTDRYVSERQLPDKAIDVMDEAGSRARLMADTKPPQLKELERRIREIDEEIRRHTHEQAFEKCKELKEQRDEAISDKEKLFKEWKQRRESREFTHVISKEDIAHIISKWTGVPLVRIEEEESMKLLKMEEELGKRVVSQKEAITAIAKAIRRARSGLKDPRRPTGSFIFLGPTGVGKTELAKALAEYLFGDENALIRIDMSEYMEKYSVSRLLGAPPGYVGYEEGGQLTEKVRTKPYSVVLLDEIEKAHPDVFSILLQVFDDGRLTDSLGHVVDFRNTIVILTSNAGTKRLKRGGGLGFTGTDEMEDFEKIKGKIQVEIKKIFNPEFLNRLDDIIIFSPLDETDIKAIIQIMLRDLNRRLEEKRIRLTMTPELTEHLVKKGYDPEYGARPLRRAIQRNVEDPMAQLLIDQTIRDGDEVLAKLDGEKVVFEVTKREEPKDEPKPEAVGASSSN